MPSPYIPNTEDDRAAMLREIGADSAEDLFQDVPAQLRSVPFRLPPPLSETELTAELRRLAGVNTSLEEYACFLGAGFYRHFVPGVIGHITGRSEFYTSYTPYQAEASQGTLQATYEYQSLVCQLTGMEVSNAGMYDGSTSAAEAALMACRLTGRGKVAALTTVNPGYRAVMSTYLEARGIALAEMEPEQDGLSADFACVLVQSPNFFGCFEDVDAWANRARASGALFVIIFDPVSLGMFRTPGASGADIAVAEGQSLGSPLSFGGPGLGIFTCRREHLRQMPGRVVGRTVDAEGRPGYVLTAATREQHIRRERATSNICTNEALVALAAAAYLAIMGKNGLRHVAGLCYQKAHYAARAISNLKGYSLAFPQLFFKEFAVCCPAPPREINRALLKEKIIGGLDISHLEANGLLLCVTETCTREQIDRLVKVLGGFQRHEK